VAGPIWGEELSFMNEKAGLDHLLLNGVDDFCRRASQRVKIQLVEFEGEIAEVFSPGRRCASRKLGRL